MNPNPVLSNQGQLCRSIRAHRTGPTSALASRAWASQCEGRMSFAADVAPSGRVSAVRFTGDAAPDLRRCIRKVLDGALVLSPAKCPGVAETITIAGGISGPRDGGTYVRLAAKRASFPASVNAQPSEGAAQQLQVTSGAARMDAARS